VFSSQSHSEFEISAIIKRCDTIVSTLEPFRSIPVLWLRQLRRSCMFVCLYEAVKKMIHVCNMAKITFQQYYTNELIRKIEKRNKNRSHENLF